MARGRGRRVCGVRRPHDIAVPGIWRPLVFQSHGGCREGGPAGIFREKGSFTAALYYCAVAGRF
jgi:hypothetical protein